MTVEWLREVAGFSGNILAKGLADGAKYVGTFVGALAASLLLTPLVREAMRKAGFLDMPAGRRIHTKPIPRGGGIAVFIVFHAALWILSWIQGGAISPQFSLSWQRNFLVASTLLVVIGVIDDKRGVKPAVKLLGQVAVALILYFSGVRLGGIFVAFPPWLDCVATVSWTVLLVNAFNLIDGMDGLASGLVTIASLGMAGSLLFMGKSAATLPYLALAGACLGFLRYNFNPASVFLGDSGSMFIGLCVVTMPLMTGSRSEMVASLGMPLLAMGVPIFDTVLAIWRRSMRAFLPDSIKGTAYLSRVMAADKDHLYHRLLRDASMNQRVVAISLYGASAVLVALGILGVVLRDRAPGLFMIAFIMAIFAVVRQMERIELWDTGQVLINRRGTIRVAVVMPIYIALDVLSLCCVWLLTHWLLDLPIHRGVFLAELPLFVAPVFISLISAKIYWRVWSRAQVRDFAVLGVAVVAGGVVSTGLAWILNVQELEVVRFGLVYSLLAIFPLAGMRIVRDSIRGVAQALERRMLREREGTQHILVFGGGVRFRSFLREMAEHTGQNKRLIVGVLDDDINLRGRLIAGYRVLGVLDELESLARQHNVTALLITCRLETDKSLEVVAVARQAGLTVSIWDTEERSLP